jgi:hypothetical protein
MAVMISLFAAAYPAYSPEWVVWLTMVVGMGMGSGIGFAA